MNTLEPQPGYPYATFVELAFVLGGHFILGLEDRSVDLQPHTGFVVPNGVVHRTRAPDRAVILMVETAPIVPPGDA